MKINQLIALVFALSMLLSCTGSSSVLTTPSGRPGDLLIVIDDELWQSEGGDTLRGTFNQDIIGLPWDEPLFDISRVNQQNFSNILRTARSVIDVDIDRKFTQAKVRYQKNVYSNTQRYIIIQLPDMASFKPIVEKEGNKMISFLYQGERDRFLLNYRKYNEQTLAQRVQDSMGISMVIPSNFSRQSFNDDFIWMASRSNDIMQYLAIYSYDYTSEDQLTKESLIETRNRLMKAHIPGSADGSYMATGTFYPPVMTEFLSNGTWIGEIRGIWETVGDMMGGPFVSQTRIDEVNNKVITVEAFIFAPNQNKRNTMRQLESLLYTVKLPAEIEKEKMAKEAEKKKAEKE